MTGSDFLYKPLDQYSDLARADRSTEALGAASPEALFSLSESLTIQSWNKAAERLFGYSALEAVTKPLSLIATLSVDDGELFEGLRAGGVARHRLRCTRKDGTIFPAELNMAAILGAPRLLGIAVSVRDLTMEAAREAAHGAELAAARAEIARLDAILDALDAPLIVYDPAGSVHRANKAARDLFQLAAADDVRGAGGVSRAVLSYPDGRPLAVDFTPHRSALRGETVAGQELCVATAHGPRAFLCSSFPVPMRGARGAVEIWRDVTDLRRREAHITALSAQLADQSRTLLDTVHAMAARSSRDLAGRTEFLTGYSDRLEALRKAQDLLWNAPQFDVSLHDLVATQTGHVAAARSQRVTCSGRDLFLRPDAAQLIGMALYELALKSAQAGALSTLVGSVVVKWSVSRNEDGPATFSIAWREVDAPPLPTLTAASLGPVSIAAGAVRGASTLRYEPGGFTWTLDAPLEAISNDDAAPDTSSSYRIQSTAMKQLHRLWLRLRPAGGLPRFAEFDVAYVQVRDRMIVARIHADEAGAQTVEFAHVGQRLLDLMNEDDAAPSHIALSRDEVLGTFEGGYDRIVQSQKPSYEYAEFKLGPSETLLFEQILLPMADAAGAISHIVGMVSFDKTDALA